MEGHYILKKGLIQQEDIYIYIYMHQTAPNYIKQNLRDLEIVQQQ